MKERDIISVLGGFQRPVLEDITYLLGADEVSYRQRKPDLVASLSDYLHRKPRRWLNCLPERDLKLLRKLVEYGPGRVQYIEMGHYHSILEVSGLVEVSDDQQRYQKVSISREVYEIVAPYVEEAINKGESSGRFEFERAGLGFLNIYGRVSVQQFLDFVQDWCDAGYGPGMKKLLVLVQDSPLIKMSRFTDDYGDYLITPCLENLPNLVEDRERYGYKEELLNPVAMDTIVGAGEGAPFFTVSMNSPEGRALEEMLRSIGYNNLDITHIAHDIWLDAQVEEQGEMIYDAIYAKDETIHSDFEFKQCLQIVADYANSIPLWKFCGKSAREQGLVLFYLPDEFLNNYDEAGDADRDVPSWSMPDPTVSEGYEKALPEDLLKLLPGGFPFGMSVPHVAPDDACPCGSGLRYRHCHGKLLN